MSKVNFERMSIKDIEALILEAHTAKADKISDKRRELRAQFAKVAAERGFELSEIFAGLKTRGGLSKRTGKFTYRNPSDPSQTWAGWGRKPTWLIEKIKAGKSLESFRA